MHGQLISLVTNDNIYPSNYATQIETIDIKSNSTFYFSKINGDAIIFDGLIIPKSLNIKNIQIIMNNNIITVPFNVIYNIKITSDNIIINLSPELFFLNNDNRMLIKNKLTLPLLNNDIGFKLNSNECFDYKIIVNYVVYDTLPRLEIKNNDLEFDIYQYQKFSIKSNIIKLSPKMISNGLFIRLNSQLIKYEFFLQDYTHTKLSKDLIDFYSFLQYSSKDNYLYYIPFNVLSDIDGNINFEKIESIEINLTTNDNNYNGYIYIKNLNKLIIKG